MSKHHRHASRGFTLIELLVVLLIVAIITSAASVSMGNTHVRQLDEEAARLSALLEVAKARARMSGFVVVWQANDTGFEWQVLSSALNHAATQGSGSNPTPNPAGAAPSTHHLVKDLPMKWLYAGTQAMATTHPSVFATSAGKQGLEAAASQAISMPRLQLGPEAISTPQALLLQRRDTALANQPVLAQRRLGSDGVRPFDLILDASP